MLTIKQITDAAIVAAKEFPIKNIRLFGSYANGSASRESDVDLLVEFETDAVSLIILSQLRFRMEELLKVEVDVIHGPIPEDSMIEVGKTVELYAA